MNESSYQAHHIWVAHDERYVVYRGSHHSKWERDPIYGKEVMPDDCEVVATYDPYSLGLNEAISRAAAIKMALNQNISLSDLGLDE